MVCAMSDNDIFGSVLTRCPASGRTLDTGLVSNAASLRSTFGVFSRVFCAHCQTDHEWSVVSSWIALPGESAD